VSDCIFCRIANKEIPSDIVLETDEVIAFRDLNPQAPTHVLVIPKRHVEGIAAAGETDPLHALFAAAAEVARRENIQNSGYRVVVNEGMHGGQSVFHLHLHVLGGRVMTWPPG
jgi:histidine triad (HIT) family protein